MTGTVAARTGVTEAGALPDHNRFPALDGVRAIAVMGVVLTHSAYWTGRYVTGVGSALLVHADIGVPLFFVLSGFLLSREWFVASRQRRPPVRTVAYLWRRALRILPMYWVTVVLAFTLLAENRSVTWWDWLRHGTLVQAYRPQWQRQGLTQTWSLCTEAAFYLVLPLLAMAVVALARRLGLAWAGVAVAGALVVANEVWIAWYHQTSLGIYSTAHYWLPTTISYFAAGIAIAAIHTELASGAPSPRWTWARDLGDSAGTCWLIAGALFLLVVTPITGATSGHTGAAQQIARNLLYAAVATAFVWPAVFSRTRTVQWVLGNRAMRYLGSISYSIFLLHLLVLNTVMHVFGYHLFSGSTLRVFVATFGITVGLAALSYRWVEQPAMRLRPLVPAHRVRDATAA